MKRKILSIVLCLGLTAALVSGCTENIGSKVSFSSDSVSEKGTAESVSAASAEAAESTPENASAEAAANSSENSAASEDKAEDSSKAPLGTATDILWKNPHAHRKPSSGVEHSEEDYQKHLTVYCLNEGKCDAFVMFSGTSNAVVIDCGEPMDGDDILEVLEEHDIHHVSALILSHFDEDHIGGADEVINGTDVEKIYVTHSPKHSKQVKELYEAMELNNKTPVEVSEYTSFEVDGTQYEIYPPLKKSYGDNEDNESNNSSLLVKVTNADNSMLFTGDCETERLYELIESDYDFTCDILKFPHHGEYEKNTEEFIKKVTPQYVVITCSPDAPGDQKTYDILDKYEIETYRTLDGEILIDTLPGEIKIDQYDD